MAVEIVLSNLIHDTMDLSSTPPDPEKARGRLICATGTVVNGASDSSGSMYHLATLPGRAVVHEDTFFDVEDWGFAQVVIGTKTDTDALVDQTLVTEDIVTPIVAGDANHGKFWWEVLGLSAQPNQIEIWAHAEAGATGAGSMDFRFAYLMP